MFVKQRCHCEPDLARRETLNFLTKEGGWGREKQNWAPAARPTLSTRCLAAFLMCFGYLRTFCIALRADDTSQLTFARDTDLKEEGANS